MNCLILCRNETESVHHLIEAANEILSISKLKTELSMRTMLGILLNQSCVQSSNYNDSEHLLSTIKCFDMIFRRANRDAIEQFYTKNNLGLLAQILAVNEEILSKTASQPLRYFDLSNIRPR